MIIRTTQNSVRAASITGAEFSYSQPLKFLPGWGKHFTVFANGTKLDLDGSADADFSGFIDTSASWGVTFSPKRYTVMFKWNYRGEQKLAAQTGGQYGATTGFYEYYAARTYLDTNFEYRFKKGFSAFFNARNALNEPQVRQRFNAVSPEYAKFNQQEEFGIQMTVGVKGTF